VGFPNIFVSGEAGLREPGCILSGRRLAMEEAFDQDFFLLFLSGLERTSRSSIISRLLPNRSFSRTSAIKSCLLTFMGSELLFMEQYIWTRRSAFLSSSLPFP